MRDQLLNLVRASLLLHGLLRSDARLLVAVSGGPDSLCLLHLLDRLRRAGGPALHVAHLDHGFRGAESAAEAAFVSATAVAWGLPATVERRDVPALARRQRLGAPAAARQARYAFLAETARAVGAHAVALAHQADDQAETVLLHALRGAGPAGLRGMRDLVPFAEWVLYGGQPAEASTADLQSASLDLHPPLIRPLLRASRAEIVAYGTAHALQPRDDPTNRDMRYARPRLRHQLLPALTSHSPRAVAALGRAAQICAEDYDFIQGQLDARWPELVVAGPGWLRMRAEIWVGLHPALQRYALRRASAAFGQPELSLAQIEAVRALVPGGRAPLGPGLVAERDQAGLQIGRQDAQRSPAEPQLAATELPLAVPGITPLGPGWVCVVGHEPPPAPDSWWVAIDAAALDGPLMLRRRRPGDRFRPAGGRGGRLVQNFFVDVRLPRPLRDAWPLLATPSAIVWVAGLRADARFAAGSATQDTIWVGIVASDE